MPLYEFRCSGCGQRFERLLSVSARDREHSCPFCPEGVALRAVSRPALLMGVPTGVGRAAYPTSWQQTGEGDAQIIRHWQRRVERERAEEARHPELTGLRRQEAERRFAPKSGQPPAAPHPAGQPVGGTGAAPSPPAGHRYTQGHAHPHPGGGR